VIDPVWDLVASRGRRLVSLIAGTSPKVTMASDSPAKRRRPGGRGQPE
jgi:hypothetical protein